jgi:hypothetical protein
MMVPWGTSVRRRNTPSNDLMRIPGPEAVSGCKIER